MLGKPVNRNRLIALFAALTVGSMALFFNLYDPWMPIGENLIADGSFETPECTNCWSGWNNDLIRLVQQGGVELSTTPEKNSVLRMTFRDIDNIPAFRVTLRAKAENITKGKRGYNLPRTVFFYRDSKGKGIFNHPHTVLMIPEDAGWKTYSDQFPVPENAQSAHLYLQNLGTQGTAQFGNISVVPVTLRPSAPVFNILFVLLWISAFVAVICALMPWKSWTGGGALMCALLIIVGVALPGKILNKTILDSVDLAGDAVRTFLPAPEPAIAQKPPTTGKPAAAPKKPPRKTRGPRSYFTPEYTLIDFAHQAGHFALFMLLAAFSAAAWAPAKKPAKLLVSVIAGLLLFAAATEVLQYITIDRRAGLSDMTIDLLGILSALIPMFLLRLRKRPA